MSLNPKTTALCLCLLAAGCTIYHAMKKEAEGRHHFSVIVRLGDSVEAFVKQVSKG